MKVGYSCSSIFFLVVVTDDKNDVSGYQPFFKDSVEIFIDMLDKREAVSPENWVLQGGPAQFRAQWYKDKADADLHYSAESPVPVGDEEGAYAVTNPAEGKTLYEIELKVAEKVREEGRARVQSGEGSFGLVVSVNDAEDGDRVTQYFWAGGKSLEPGKYNEALRWRRPVLPWNRSDAPETYGGDGSSIYGEAVFKPAKKKPEGSESE